MSANFPVMQKEFFAIAATENFAPIIRVKPEIYRSVISPIRKVELIFHRCFCNFTDQLEV